MPYNDENNKNCQDETKTTSNCIKFIPILVRDTVCRKLETKTLLIRRQEKAILVIYNFYKKF